MPSKPRKLLAPALSLSFLAAACSFDDTGIHWLWSPQPIVAVIVALGAAGAWTAVAWSWRRHAARPRP